MSVRERQAAMARCERWLSAREPATAAELLRSAADALPADTLPDRYGDGDWVESFELRMAELLGHEAAVLMPSGTMAQQIALRIHAERRRNFTVAWHPTCHLALWEHGGYSQLHGLHAELVGDRDRLLTLGDLKALTVPIAALLLELPQREIGGRLPEREELDEQLAWARERGVATHLDGARLWEAAPYYGVSPAEIARRFDSVYVSLYKGLGGLAGSVLAGPAEFIAEARIWRRRHGGTLPSLFPFAASALRGLEVLVGRMPEFLWHARAIAAALGGVPGVVGVVPEPPQTPLFHVHLRGEPDTLWEGALEIAERERVWLVSKLVPSILPGVTRTELHLGEPALAIEPDEAAALFARLLGG